LGIPVNIIKALDERWLNNEECGILERSGLRSAEYREVVPQNVIDYLEDIVELVATAEDARATILTALGMAYEMGLEDGGKV
jgi:hypothetical protein